MVALSVVHVEVLVPAEHLLMRRELEICERVGQGVDLSNDSLGTAPYARAYAAVASLRASGVVAAVIAVRAAVSWAVRQSFAAVVHSAGALASIVGAVCAAKGPASAAKRLGSIRKRVVMNPS